MTNTEGLAGLPPLDGDKDAETGLLSHERALELLSDHDLLTRYAHIELARMAFGRAAFPARLACLTALLARPAAAFGDGDQLLEDEEAVHDIAIEYLKAHGYRIVPPEFPALRSADDAGVSGSAASSAADGGDPGGDGGD